jgi:hypothetical protein
MKDRKIFVRRLFFFFSIMSLMFAQSALAASFVAELHSVSPEESRVYKLFVRGIQYRLEFMEEGYEMFAIVDPAEGISRVARVSEGQYFEMPCSDARSILNDPFQSLAFMKFMGESTPEGEEGVNGYACEKTLVMYKDQKVATYWTPEVLEFPIKIVMYPPNEKVLEIINIRVMELDDSLFVIPEDYEQIKY